MVKPDTGVFVYVGAYADEATARADHDTVNALHSSDMVGRFETAVITKDQRGEVHVVKTEPGVHEKARRGLVVGAVLGVLFPPSIAATAAVGGLVGAGVASAGGRSLKSIPTGDLDALGQLIAAGEAALVVVGEASAGRAIEHASLNATRHGRRDVKSSYPELETEVLADLQARQDVGPAT